MSNGFLSILKLRSLILHNFVVVIFYLLILSGESLAISAIEVKLYKSFDIEIGKYDQFGFSPLGKFVYAIDKNKKLKVWKTADLSSKLELDEKYKEAYFSPDDRFIAVFLDKGFKDINLNTDSTQITVSKIKDPIDYIAWSPDGKLLAVRLNQNTVDLLQIDSGTFKPSLVVHKEKRRKKLLVSRILDIPLRVNAEFSSDGKRLITVSSDSTAELWDVESGKLLRTFTHAAVTSSNQDTNDVNFEIYDGRFSPDGKWILTQSFNSTKMWDAHIGNLVQNFLGFWLPRFSPDGKFVGLFTDSGNSASQLFDLQNQKMLKVISKYSGEIAEWSPDGSKFVTDRTRDEGSKKRAFLWETATGKQIVEMQTYANYCFDFVSTCISNSDEFSFSSDSRLLMVQNQKSVTFRDAETGRVIGEVIGARSPSFWSPKNDMILARDTRDRKISLWKILR